MNGDFLVIGGGIAGVSIAAALAGSGAVILAEQEPQLSYHATGRSAAIFVDSYGNRIVQRLSRYSRPLLERNEPGADTPLLAPRGLLWLVAADEALPKVDSHFMAFPQLTPPEIRKLIPTLRAEAVRAAFMEETAADVDVHALQSTYQRRVRSLGGTILKDAQVQGAERSGNTWLVKAGDYTISTPVVINAAGAWAGLTGSLFGAADPGLLPTRRSVALVKPPAAVEVSAWPMVAAISETIYFKPEAAKLLISPSDATACVPHDAQPDDIDLAVAVDRFERLSDWTISRLDGSWAGLRTLTPDGGPIVGRDPAVDGLFWLAGQGGYGIQTAPATAALLAAQVLGQSIPADLAAIVDAVAPGRRRPITNE